MLSKATIILALAASFTQARFQQEQAVAAIISAVQGGPAGLAPTLGGASVSTLLGGANACDKLKLADRVATELGGGADAIAAARALVAAEKNFNPFVTSIPSICDEPSLPATASLRGITPKVDPAVGGAAVANALSASTLANPLAAGGKSVADLMAENGFTNFTTQALDGTAGAAPVGGGNGGGGAAAPPASTTVVVAAPPAATETAIAGCPATRLRKRYAGGESVEMKRKRMDTMRMVLRMRRELSELEAML